MDLEQVSQDVKIGCVPVNLGLAALCARRLNQTVSAQRDAAIRCCHGAHGSLGKRRLGRCLVVAAHLGKVLQAPRAQREYILRLPGGSRLTAAQHHIGAAAREPVHPRLLLLRAAMVQAQWQDEGVAETHVQERGRHALGQFPGALIRVVHAGPDRARTLNARKGAQPPDADRVGAQDQKRLERFQHAQLTPGLVRRDELPVDLGSRAHRVGT